MSDNPQTSPATPAPPPSGVGGDVVIPRAVRRAAARANELQRQMHGEDTPEGDTPPVEQQEQQPQLPMELPPAAAPPAQPPSDSWEQRYRTLQGKYDSEMPSLKAQVTSLERLIAQMRDAPVARETPPPPAPAGPPASIIPDEDVESYGPELIAASRRWAAAEVEQKIASLHNEIASLKGAQTQLTETQLRERVQKDLDSDPELSNGRWRQLNFDQEFLNWLQELDPLAGVSRNVMLQHAYSGGDAVRTGRFFKAYIAEHTVPGQQPYPSQTAMPNGRTQAGGPRLEEWASPGRAAGSTFPGNGATAERRVWTNREISQFYRERTDGKWRGREPEATQLEADILAAGAEGRVRNV
jgi:hypothetical protein